MPSLWGKSHMKSVPSYTKILTLGSAYTENALVGEVIVQEKVDGSQFSFGINEDGELVMRSKGQQLFLDNFAPMFDKCVKFVQNLKFDVPPDTYFYCEYLQRPKHNTLKYGREPQNNLILFDVLMGGRWLSKPELSSWADKLKIDVITEIFQGLVDVNEIKSFMEIESFLGGERIEGVVIKNYETQVFTKYVQESFKERNADEWKTKKSGGGIPEFIASFKSVARWEKAIIHAREKGDLVVSPKDIGMLMKMVAEDVRQEETENVKNHLYQYYIDEILRVSVRGFPEWYKDKLLENLR